MGGLGGGGVGLPPYKARLMGLTWRQALQIGGAYEQRGGNDLMELICVVEHRGVYDLGGIFVYTDFLRCWVSMWSSWTALAWRRRCLTGPMLSSWFRKNEKP